MRIIQYIAFSNWLLSLSNMHLSFLRAFSWLGNSLVVNSIGLPQWLSNARDAGSIMGWEDPLATHSRILACKIPWTEGPGGLWWDRKRVGHDLAMKQYYIVWMDHSLSIYSSTEGYLGCFPEWEIMNKTAINKDLCGPNFSALLDKYQGVWLLDYVRVCLI